MQLDWAGNIRELENTLERAIITSNSSVLKESSFKFYLQSVSAKSNLNGFASKSINVVAGSTTSYTLTVTSATGSKAGLDVAVRNGTLATNQTGTKLLSGELVHSTGKSFASGIASFTFNYVAPSSPVVDTLFSTGLASAGGQNGSWNWNDKRVKVYTVSGVEPNSNIVPDKYSLKQNFPNPFNPSTTIIYSIKNSGKVNLKVYDSKGRIVSELVNNNQTKGEYKVDFDASTLASGVYYYTLNTKDFSETKSMVLIK
ncbi:unnamed protein product [Rotaria sp. Silwood1]|nr:unnamed protein product [Rotaria sp. Silwood1]